MSRNEIVVTVLGLVGTFLLPWPAEQAAAVAPVGAETRSDRVVPCASTPRPEAVGLPAPDHVRTHAGLGRV